MEKIEKRLIDQNIDYYFQLSGEISEIERDLEKLKKLGATHIDIDDGNSEYGVGFQAYKKRLETDEEFEKRKEEQELFKKKNEERELAEFKKLKEKYEK